ncbi:MAG: hypothetical protein OHK0029_31450 [Armatimonadaceae bacterium]
MSLWAWAVALFALLMAGCGGGGDSPSQGGNGGGGGGNTQNPVITGRVVDDYSGGAAVPGATVTLRRNNGTVLGSAVTDASGNFSFQVPPTSETTLATVTSPANIPLYLQGRANSQIINISTGAQVAPLNAGQTVTINFQVLSQAGGPPPPPF